MRRPLDVPLTDSAAPAGVNGLRRDGTCRDEAFGARASVCGPVRSAHGRTIPPAPLHAVRRRHRTSQGAARGQNRLGFALQLCAFRYPGRILAVGEAIPLNVLRFIAAQLGMRAEDLDGYAVREETRREHLAELRRIYGYRMFSGRCARDLKVWLENEAEAARSNEGPGAAVRGGVPASSGDPAGLRSSLRSAGDRSSHRIARLRRQGERYFADGLRDISGDRRLAICAVCAVEWRGAIADAVVETHDRIVGQTFRSSQRRCYTRIQDSRASAA